MKGNKAMTGQSQSYKQYYNMHRKQKIDKAEYYVQNYPCPALNHGKVYTDNSDNNKPK